MTLTLNHGDAELVLAPEAGGSVLAYRKAGLDLLRPAPVGNTDPLLMAAFPMFPFCGRVPGAHFHFAGHDVALPVLDRFAPDAIHGFGWQSVWQVARQGRDHARLTHRQGKGPWPWAYVAHQDFRLTGSGLELTLRLRNVSSDPMPAGMGWHPYFPRDGARITAATTCVWQAPAGLPQCAALPAGGMMDLRAGQPVAALDIDHAFDVTTPGAVLSWPDRTLSLGADPVFSRLVVFVPPGEDFFCVEPETHIPGAVRHTLPPWRTGLCILAPGATLEGRITLTLT